MTREITVSIHLDPRNRRVGELERMTANRIGRSRLWVGASDPTHGSLTV